MAVLNHESAAVEFTHDAPGTDEKDWLRWPGLRDVPEFGWEGIDHVVVVAAHPDDETLGAGGLIATAAARGLDVDVVIATDGEGSHPDSPTTTMTELADVRAQEVRRAVAELAPDAGLHLLHLPDGGVAGDVEILRSRIERLVTSSSLLVAPWTADGHPDHDLAGAAAVEVAAENSLSCLLYPIWVWHWASPGDSRVPWRSGTRLVLDPAAREAKQRAMERHVSQIRPLSDAPGDEVLLNEQVQEHFTRVHEFFLRPDDAATSESLGAEFFEEFYRDNGADPWGFEDRWYEQRKRALTLAALPRERFARALEVGCSAGAFTVELAPRCDQLLAVDIAADVARRAGERAAEAGFNHVQTRAARVPQEFPDGQFDLVVLSEVAYYCDGPDLADLVTRISGALTEDGVVVACHWRHLVEGYPLTGDEVHRVLRATSGWELLASHEEEDFLLDVFVPAPAVSVARAGGLVG